MTNTTHTPGIDLGKLDKLKPDVPDDVTIGPDGALFRRGYRAAIADVRAMLSQPCVTEQADALPIFCYAKTIHYGWPEFNASNEFSDGSTDGEALVKLSDVRAALQQAAPEAPADHNSQDPNCSCPSGGGSLRWPCLVHPPEAPATQQAVAGVESVLQARSPEGDPWVEVTREQYDKARANGYETRALQVVKPAATTASASNAQSAYQREHEEFKRQNCATSPSRDAALLDKDSEKQKFIAWAQVFHRNARSYTARDFDHGLIAWLAAKSDAAQAPHAGADTERLDWLNQNFFSDQKDEWDERLAPDSIKWKFFGPMSVQGDIRRVIDAAIAASAAEQGDKK